MKASEIRPELLVLLVPFAMLSYYFSHIHPLPVYHYAIAATLLGWSLLSLRQASLAFLISMVILDDTSKFYSEQLMLQVPFVSLYSLQVGGLTLYLLLATYFVTMNLVAAFGSRKKLSGRPFTLKHISEELRVILVVGTVSAIVGLVNILHAGRIYVSDLGFFINILLGYLIISNFRNDERMFYTAFLLLIYALASKAISIAFDALMFSVSPGLVTISPGTESYLMILVILFCLTNLHAGSVFFSGRKIFLLAMIVLALSYYSFTAARGRVVVALITLLLFVFEIKAKKGLIYLVLMIVTALVVIPFIPEQYLAYFAWKLDSFVPSLEGGQSALVRYISLQNILAEQLHSFYQIFIGTGLGGYFTSQHTSFPFNLTGTDSFSDEWIKSDTFYKPHGSWLFLLLKTGLVGFLLLYGTLAYHNFKNLATIRSYPNMGGASVRILIVVLPVILPTMLINFSSKLQLLTGALLGFSFFGLRFLRCLQLEKTTGPKF